VSRAVICQRCGESVQHRLDIWLPGTGIGRTVCGLPVERGGWGIYEARVAPACPCPQCYATGPSDVSAAQTSGKSPSRSGAT
jgi:hypothetical protein